MHHPDMVQIGRIAHHAVDDGMGGIDALGGKLLQVLVDPGGQPAKVIHAHFRPR